MSYWSDQEPNVCAEWTSDKISAFRKLGHRVILITSPSSTLIDSANLEVRRVRTRLSLQTWIAEADAMPRDNLSRGPKAPFVTKTLGRALDSIFKKLAGNESHGKWFWSFSAAIELLKVARQKDLDLTFVTGGPSGAHFGAWMAHRFITSPLVLEFQDPFIGSQFVASNRAFAVLDKVENAFVKRADLVITTSKGSLKNLVEKYPEHSEKLRNIYPGGGQIVIHEEKGKPVGNSSPRRLVHLGTLYASRDFDFLIEALPQAVTGAKSIDNYEILNLGYVEPELANRYENISNVKLLPGMPRKQALEFAGSLDGLLLIQHNDSRSDETVPFKIYDYLNSMSPIFALIRNPELEHLLEQDGCFVARLGDVREKQIEAFSHYLNRIESARPIRRPQLTTAKQLEEVLRQFG
jgi:hypothetical protein